MPFDGTIKTWNDERGFGFIVPTQGGQEIFFHIKAFRARGVRPLVGQAVSFEVEMGPQGKKRASVVNPVRQGHPRGRHGREGPAQWGTASYFAIPGFLALYVTASVFWRVPVWVAGLYLGASLLAFGMYAMDKVAATARRRRVPESALLMVGLIGGWPGAIVAQQGLRHKSVKASFRSAFWGTVVLNVGVFLLLASPVARQFLRA